jgi:hypothetical protein
VRGGGGGSRGVLLHDNTSFQLMGGLNVTLYGR